jgi:hypothetical protein
MSDREENGQVIISLATNDANGVDTGHVCAIQLDEAIDLRWGEIGSEPSYSIDGLVLKISRQRFPIFGKQHWYGNCCWTAVTMDLCWATKLLNYLSGDDRWHCEGGWCDLTDAYAEGKVTPQLLEKVSPA